jgi:hypothetical protein
MAMGDHLRVRRRTYAHHGVDLGDGTVAHLDGTPLRRRDARVVRVPLTEFCRGECVETLPEPEALEPSEIVRRALALVGRGGYDLLAWNCEHFARWCVTGRVDSEQVRRAARAGALAGVALRGLGRLAVTRAAGTVLGRAAGVLGPVGAAISVGAAAVEIYGKLRRPRLGD